MVLVQTMSDKVHIGEGTRWNGDIKIVPGPSGVEIGKYCAIGPGFTIMGINHDYRYAAMQYTFYKDMFSMEHPGITNQTKRKIRIGNDVWIGDNVAVLSGVTIGDGCVIPPAVKDYLLHIEWWNWSKEKIRRNKEFFSTPLTDLPIAQIAARACPANEFR